MEPVRLTTEMNSLRAALDISCGEIMDAEYKWKYGIRKPGALEKARENFKIKLKKLQKYAVQVLQTFDIEKDGYYYFQCSISTEPFMMPA